MQHLPPVDDPEQQSPSIIVQHAEIHDRAGSVWKVFSIIAAHLLVTATVASLAIRSLKTIIMYIYDAYGVVGVVLAVGIVWMWYVLMGDIMEDISERSFVGRLARRLLWPFNEFISVCFFVYANLFFLFASLCVATSFECLFLTKCAVWTCDDCGDVSNEAVVRCLLTTAFVVGGLAFHAFTTKSGFTGFGPYLMASMFALVGVCTTTCFVYLFGVRPPHMYMRSHWASAMIFSTNLVWETQQLVGGSCKRHCSLRDQRHLGEHLGVAHKLYCGLVFRLLEVYCGPVP